MNIHEHHKSTVPFNTPFLPEDFCQWRIDGTYMDPYSCEYYYLCRNLEAHFRRCDEGAIYDGYRNVCNFPDQVEQSYICSKCPEYAEECP